MRLVVLDRDGVINQDSPDFVRSPDEWRPLPGSLEAIARLSNKGWTIAVASNQSGIGRGYFSETTLAAIHDKMLKATGKVGGRIDRIVYCPHLPESGCPCRKPRPGLLNQLATIYDVAPSALLVIGDSARDLNAGLAVGARVFLVRTGNGKKTEPDFADSGAVAVFDDLAAAAEFIVAESAP